MTPRGYNPMLWDCKEKGCFNELRRPKIEVFAQCFPGKINFGDVDGWVEMNGYFCVLEWKGDRGKLKTGQIITYTRFSKVPGNVVFVVEGDAKDMTVKRYHFFWKGKQLPWREGDLEDVKASMKSWADQAKGGVIDKK